MEAIAENWRDLDTVYDYLPVGVMALTRDRRVTIWNQQMESWSGVARSSIINRKLAELFSSFDDVKFSDQLTEVFDIGAPATLSAQFHGQVVPLSLPGGGDRIQQATVVPIPGTDGSTWALFAIQDVSDLTLQVQTHRGMKAGSVLETHRAEAAKLLAERHNEQLAKLKRDLDQFAYLASHDLQEPLRTLTSFSTFLQADLGADLPEAAARDLEHIVAAAARMRRLIDDLLALSRVSRVEMWWSRISLESCVADAMKPLEHGAQELKATIVGAENLPTVMGDHKLLTQVFQNMLGNAMKFADTSRPCVIEISAEHDGSGWVIKTKDNGIGVGEEYLTKIFAPFQRLHGADKYPGSGMGLAICERAIERHGGAVWAIPNETVGSCFQFTLPDRQD
ncbi:MAG: ATP-binding protein [Acidobacteria bacterium]|nr:ATP-binding protein [Acidobacteriota bacterium]MDA1235038.1 ATP-binding protein [Acidobacteriota bacterium]